MVQWIGCLMVGAVHVIVAIHGLLTRNTESVLMRSNENGIAPMLIGDANVHGDNRESRLRYGITIAFQKHRMASVLPVEHCHLADSSI